MYKFIIHHSGNACFKADFINSIPKVDGLSYSVVIDEEQELSNGEINYSGFINYSNLNKNQIVELIKKTLNHEWEVYIDDVLILSNYHEQSMIKAWCEALWVNVDEKLPTEGVDILIYIPDLKDIDLGWLDDGVNGERCVASSKFGYDLKFIKKWFPISSENMFELHDRSSLEGSCVSEINKDLLIRHEKPVLIYSSKTGYAIAKLNKIDDDYYFVGDDVEIDFDEVEKFNFLPLLEE